MVLDGVLSFILMVIGQCLRTTAANHQHPLFGEILSSYTILGEITSSLSLMFASSLLETFHSPLPPSVSFFKTLPTETTRRWAVYLLLLEKPGHRPLIYIGSGTSHIAGVYGRLVVVDI